VLDLMIHDIGIVLELVKSPIVKIDSVDNTFIVEELDDQHLVIHEKMLPLLKMRLDEVCS